MKGIGKTACRNLVRRERIVHERVGDPDGSEIAVEKRAWYRVLVVDGLGADTQAFEAGEEERLVLDNRPAERPSPQIVIEIGLRYAGALTEKVVRSAPVRPCLQESTPMNGVGPRLGRRVEHAASGATHFRIVGVDLHLHFLKRLDGGKERRRVGERRVRHTVEQIVVRGRPGSVNADRVPGALTHNALLAAGLNGTIAEKQKLQEVSTVQRQFRNLPLSHCRPYRRRLRVDRCRGRLHVDGLRHLPHRQFQIDADDLSNVERNVGALGGTEALLLRGHGVHPNRQKRKHIVARSARGSPASLVCLRVGQSDLGSSHHSSARVLHGARDLAGGRLCP